MKSIDIIWTLCPWELVHDIVHLLVDRGGVFELHLLSFQTQEAVQFSIPSSGCCYAATIKAAAILIQTTKQDEYQDHLWLTFVSPLLSRSAKTILIISEKPFRQNTDTTLQSIVGPKWLQPPKPVNLTRSHDVKRWTSSTSGSWWQSQSCHPHSCL